MSGLGKWGKEPHLLGDWATEQKPIACQLPGNSDSSLINTGVSLSTDIPPDIGGAAGALSIRIAGPVSGTLTVGGTTEVPRRLVLECSTSRIDLRVRGNGGIGPEPAHR